MRLHTLALACLATLLLSSAACASITISYPVTSQFSHVVKDADFQGDFRYLEGKKLGSIAPGQLLKLVFSRDTGSTFLWDKIKSNASASWNERVTLGDSITVSLIVPSDAPEGEYVLNFTGTAAYEPGIVKTPEILPLTVQVTKGVYSLEVSSSQELFVDYPNSIFFKIKSLSLAQDVLTFSFSTVPTKWYKTVQTEMKPFEEKRLMLSVTPVQEKELATALVASRESGLTDSYDLLLKIKPATLQTKLKSLGEGFSIIPVLLQPFYSLLSLLGLAA